MERHSSSRGREWRRLQVSSGAAALDELKEQEAGVSAAKNEEKEGKDGMEEPAAGQRLKFKAARAQLL